MLTGYYSILDQQNRAAMGMFPTCLHSEQVCQDVHGNILHFCTKIMHFWVSFPDGIVCCPVSSARKCNDLESNKEMETITEGNQSIHEMEKQRLVSTTADTTDNKYETYTKPELNRVKEEEQCEGISESDSQHDHKNSNVIQCSVCEEKYDNITEYTHHLNMHLQDSDQLTENIEECREKWKHGYCTENDVKMSNKLELHELTPGVTMMDNDSGDNSEMKQEFFPQPHNNIGIKSESFSKLNGQSAEEISTRTTLDTFDRDLKSFPSYCVT